MSINVVKVPSSEGINWLKRAWALTRSNPLAVHAAMFGYLLLAFTAGAVPVIGPALPLVALPVLYVGMMTVYRAVARGEPLSPKLMFAGFAPVEVLRPLLIMGVLYALCVFALFQFTALFDDGLLKRIVSGTQKLDPEAINQAQLTVSLALVLLLYVPVSWLFWMAPQFVAWHGMGVGKALFYSFAGCWRNMGAFSMFFAACSGLVVAAAIGASVIGLVFGSVSIAQALLLPISLLFGVISYVAFYVSYESVVREVTPPPAAEPPIS